MDASRNRRLQEAFAAAAASPPAEREAVLGNALPDDPELRREVLDLLRHADAAVTGEIFPTLPSLDPVPPAPPIHGERLGPYTLLRLLGEGGMGAVYLAEREDVGMRVAVKRLRHGRLADPHHQARFLAERRILARLQHPGIARLLDAGVAFDGLPYMVMELVDGEPIDRWCDARQLSVMDRVQLLATACDAVQFAHDHGVVHRDIKPSNLLVTAAGEPRLVDFGVARLAEADAPEPTRTGALLATPAYAAPEQLRGEPATPAGDVYALGVVLYELLVGRRPDPSTGEHLPPASAIPASAETAARRGATPGGLHRQVRGGLDAIVSRALHPDPARRYPSATALADDLRRHLAGRRVRARGRLSRRVAAAGGLAAAAALAAALHAGGMRSGSAAPSPGERPAVLAPQVVAVLPFELNGGPELAYLRDGLAELVGRGLDGAGMLRSVDSGTLRAAQGPPGQTPAPPADVARRLGASLYAVGSVTAGGDRLRAHVSLHDAAGGGVVANADAEGEAARLFELADTLVARLIADRLSDPGERLTRTAVRTTGSLPALKAYLEGEAFLRYGDNTSAVAAYQRAIAEDSGFALAHYRLSYAATSTGLSGVMHQAARAAVRHQGRLSARDRLLVQAWAARLRGDVDGAEAHLHSLLHQYPSDVEGRFQLADLLFHHNPLRGRSVLEARAGLERALEVDPTAREAMDHLTKVLMVQGDARALAALRARIARERPNDPVLRMLAMMEDARRPGAPLDSAVARLRRHGDIVAITRVWWIGVYGRDPGATHALAEALLEPTRAPELRAWGHLTRADLALAAGRRRDAQGELARAAPLAPLRAAELRGFYAVLPFAPASPAELRALRRTLERWPAADAAAASSPPFADFYPGARPAVRRYVIGLLSVRLGDFATAEREVRALRRTDGSAAARSYGGMLAAGVEAELLRARGRPGEALAVLERMPLDLPRDYDPVHFATQAPERYMRAELLREAGRESEALGWYASLEEVSVAELVYLAPSLLRRAEILERMARPREARALRARAATLWRGADPETRQGWR
jgi:tRNA A-37 threonylcarbamoyl transferase component Bud32/TolB-like protein